MKSKSQQVAIAEIVLGKPDRTQQAETLYWLINGRWLRVPDYLRDLNAMHDAEKVLMCGGLDCFEPYCRELERIAQDNESAHVATAEQRAESFLRTVGKWTDE